MPLLHCYPLVVEKFTKNCSIEAREESMCGEGLLYKDLYMTIVWLQISKLKGK